MSRSHVFFFKQKTAYEIKECDWSSDVCSSDLGQEKVADKGDPYWTEIRAFDAKGGPVQGLPGEGGYFEMVLPQVFFEAKPKSLTIDWIDFYRQ